MAFHSLHFLAFFPLVLALSWALRRNLLTTLNGALRGVTLHPR